MSTIAQTFEMNSMVAVPGNSKYAVIFDSTLGPSQSYNSTTVPTSTATIGPFRGLFAGMRVFGSITVSTNDATLIRYGFDGSTFVSKATATLTAGTPYDLSWLFEDADWGLYMLAGATAPTAVKLSLGFTNQRAT